MNKNWIDEKLKMLSQELGIFKLNTNEFYFEPTSGIYNMLETGEEEDLYCVITEISRHLGIANITGVEYEWGIKMAPEVAGQAIFDNEAKKIRVPFFYAGKQYAVGTILAHEISHVFLFNKRIWLSDTNQNEMLTDLTAIFIGLGKLMINGLFVDANELKREGHVLGYLTPDLVVYSYKKVAAYRSIESRIYLKNIMPEALKIIKFDQL